MTKNTDTFISRDDTKIIKAIAIILMLIHHLWEFPDRIAGGRLKYLISIFGQPSIQYVGMFGKICVSIFFFMGGYGIYLSYNNRKYDVVEKIKNLYFSYWKVFVVFIPIAFIFFSSQIAYCENQSIYDRYGRFSWNDCIANFLGISSTYNGEWWFLINYVFVIISFPIVRAIIDKNSPRINILLVIIASILAESFLPAIGNVQSIGTLNNNYLYTKFFYQGAPYISCFWMGAVVAKDGLLDRLKEAMIKSSILNPVTDIIIWGIIIYLRQTGIGDLLDIFYVPLMIVVSMDFIRRLKFLRRILLELGKQSTNMWLIHSFFCYYFYAVVKIVVAPRWAFISLLVLIAFTYISSVILTLFWEKVLKIFHRNKSHIQYRYVNQLEA